MSRIAILISGRGSNMMALCRKVEEDLLPVEVTFVASDDPDAAGLSRASEMGLRTEILPYGQNGRETAEKDLTELLRKTGTEWIVLAGFMRILSSSFVREHEGRIVNIHPSLLPSFPGATGIEDAWNYGVKVTGVTIHLVDEKVDHGVILAQAPVTLEKDDTLEDLEQKIHLVEHDIYWKTLKKVITGNGIEFKGRRALID